jgi:hypothetical protein
MVSLQVLEKSANYLNCIYVYFISVIEVYITKITIKS